MDRGRAAGVLLLLAASVVQALGVDTVTLLDRIGLYRVISMCGVVFMYLGGQRLRVV
jgi:hypothetical protein